MSSIGDAPLARILAASPAPNAIDLSVGDPDMPTPHHVVEAGVKALRDGFTRYSPRIGFLSLREAVREKLSRVNNYQPHLEDIIITGGGSPAVCIAIAAAAKSGESILVPDPGWPNYETFARNIGIHCIRYTQSVGDGAFVDLEELGSLVNEQTKLIVINSPSNPVGAAAQRSEVEALVEFARRHDLYILSDEAYESFVFSGESCSPAECGGLDRTFACYTLSKTYAMTGWRVGYFAVPPALRAVAVQLQATMNGCAPAMSQQAALAALTGPQDVVEQMCSVYRRRRDLAEDALFDTGLLSAPPRGAIYLWLDIAGSGLSGLDFTRWLAAERGVIVSAGEVYSMHNTRHVRVSLAADEARLLEGLRQIAAATSDAGRPALQ